MSVTSAVMMVPALLVLLAGVQTFLPVTGVQPSYNLCDVRPGYSVNGDFFPSVGDTSRVYINLTGASPEANYHCFMRFTTCADCRFRVESDSSFSYQNCLWTQIFNNYDGKCAPGCTYVHLFDPDYRNETARSFTTSPWPPYYSLSKKLYIVVCSNRSQVKNIHLSLNLTVVEKKQNIRGSAYDTDSVTRRFIMSPAFPNFYAENDEKYVYHFQAVNYNEYIELTFDDWNLSPQSILQFYKCDHEGPIYGSSSRPVVLSDGNELILEFHTGQPSSSSIRNFMGFKATYTFKNNRRQTQRPITDCGGYDMNRVGGLVTFDPRMSTNEYYDCIWVLKRHPDYSMIYAKLVEYDSSPTYYPDQPDRVEIRGGITSLGTSKTVITHVNVDDYKEYGFENNTGFYIRLQGRYHSARDFMLVFASYKYGDCRYHEFKCYNSRCISVSLKCDGYDHCGDNSDERNSLCGTNNDDYSRYSYTISIGVIIPMVISIFLIVVICLLIIFIRRCRTLSQQNPRGGRQPITSVSGNMARRNRRGRNRSRIRMNLTIQQDAPPSYDEVIQNTPIGYLNMAFMWSQPDVNTGMINPPSYEEATSPTTELPRLTASQNVLNQSAESSSSSDSLESHPCVIPQASDTSSDGSQLEDRLHHASFSSDSTVPDGHCYPSYDPSNSLPPSTDHSREQEQPRQQRQSKMVQDEFIECPVSSSMLRNKEQASPAEGECASVRDQGAVACPGQDQDGSQSNTSSREQSVSRGRDREHVTKKKKKSSRSRLEQAPINDSDSPRSPGRARDRRSDGSCGSPQSSGSSRGSPHSSLSSHGSPYSNDSYRRSPMSRDSSTEQGGEVVLRVPSQNQTPVPAPRGRGGGSDRRLSDTHDNRLRGTYLSLSLDTGDGEPDIFV